MATMSDLSPELVGEILARVPLTSLSSVRCTCKMWNALSKDEILCKAAEARKQFMGFMMMDSRVCSVKFDLQGIRKEEEDFVDPCIKQIDKLDQFKVYKVLQCDGLLLVVMEDNSSLLVWNPYLGHMRFIKPREIFHLLDCYALGYDSNRNHKILRITTTVYEIYDFSSHSWRVLEVTPDWDIPHYQRFVSLNGNAYFFSQEKLVIIGDVEEIEDFLLCFDFTTERFGPRLPLPFHSYVCETVALSCVRDDQLAVLYQRLEPDLVLDIWVTTNIEPTAVSWSMFLRVDMKPLTGFQFDEESGSFFIDQEKKVAVVFDLDRYRRFEIHRYQTAYIIGEDGYFKIVNLREAPDLGKPDKFYAFCYPLLSSSNYSPSLVQL
ncbi:PREDICTED: putative F-box protein At4g17200 [Camelina sativa]|uniref:F-box protein At4g17200 n=1 Tax=Camelina sativa TaxID=90675 RepID=A0ABM0V654_CAMSA|nr:PREDICTED: putative F-box protein At4g17200 [Camelina sativa]